jgi:hypothetical protein
LETSARDYAIAAIARGLIGQVPGGLRQAEGLVALRDYEDALAELVWIHGPFGARRLLHARVALLLRLLRRCEAFDRREDWAEFRRSDGESSYFPPRRWPQIPARPWRPLWLDAPPWKGER